MNWKDVTNAFGVAATSGLWPNVRAFSDEGVYILNDRDNWRMNYATVILDLQTATVNEDTTTYNVMLWYIDRQKADRSDINGIIADAISTLGEMSNWVLHKLEGISISHPMTATPFQDRFADECAGASLSLNITITNNSIC